MVLILTYAHIIMSIFWGRITGRSNGHRMAPSLPDQKLLVKGQPERARLVESGEPNFSYSLFGKKLLNQWFSAKTRRQDQSAMDFGQSQAINKFENNNYQISICQLILFYAEEY